MLKNERYDKILEILDEKKYISSQELSKRLFVSLPTIRRDLGYLQRTNQILRSHGGAKRIDSEHLVMPIDLRKTVNIAEKRRICQAASRLVNDNDIIFLDASTTVQPIAGFLSDKKNITVITNGIPLAMILLKKGIRTYCTGGEIQESSMAYTGSFAEEFVQKFNIDIMIFSSHGVNSNGIIADSSLPETQLRKVAIKQSKKVAFLCDSTKFPMSAAYNLMPLVNADYVITDSNRIKSVVPENGAEIIVV